MTSTQDRKDSVSVAVCGSGGAGVITAGEVLLAAAAHAGWHGLQTRSVGPQIRGGEAVAMVRIASHPVEAHADAFDMILAIDWRNFDRFAAEVTLSPHAVILMDEEAGDLPAVYAGHAGPVLRLPLQEVAKAAKGRANMVATGLIGEMLGMPADSLEHAVRRRFKAKGEAILDSALAALEAGQRLFHERMANHACPLAPPPMGKGERWIISGNQMAGLGALTAGVRFVAAYPITPASDLLEWMTPALAGAGGMLVQAEDELASINMIIGASFAGTPALTATSGPGLALMMEGLGLAVAAEIPVVVIDVQRGGPSTGIPTKSEQTDLNIALCGLHGEAPHLVIAPTSAADCLATTAWAVHLAEKLQSPAIVLSDQKMAQMKAITEPLPLPEWKAARKVQEPCEPNTYARYRLAADGVSPMALPGTPGCMYTADGLEHDERAVPSSRLEDHAAMLEKRARKLADHDYGDFWAEIAGEGEVAVITWGSTAGAVREAARDLGAQGVHFRRLILRLLSPPQPERLATALTGVHTVIVAENSHSGQFLHYLRAHYDIPARLVPLHHAGPRAISAREVREAVLAALMGNGTTAGNGETEGSGGRKAASGPAGAAGTGSSETEVLTR